MELLDVIYYRLRNIQIEVRVIIGIMEIKESATRKTVKNFSSEETLRAQGRGGK